MSTEASCECGPHGYWTSCFTSQICMHVCEGATKGVGYLKLGVHVCGDLMTHKPHVHVHVHVWSHGCFNTTVMKMLLMMRGEQNSAFDPIFLERAMDSCVCDYQTLKLI